MIAVTHAMKANGARQGPGCSIHSILYARLAARQELGIGAVKCWHGSTKGGKRTLDAHDHVSPTYHGRYCYCYNQDNGHDSFHQAATIGPYSNMHKLGC